MSPLIWHISKSWKAFHIYHLPNAFFLKLALISTFNTEFLLQNDLCEYTNVHKITKVILSRKPGV